MIDHLLIITKENLDGEPAVTADLETVLQVVQLVDLIGSQIPAIKLKVGVNASLVDRLGDDTPALLDTPLEQDLLRGLALLLRELQKSRVLVERGVRGAKTGVAGRVDALGGVVRHQLGRGVVGMQLDLVHSGDDLAARVVEELLKVLDTEVGDTNVTDLAGGRKLLHFLPGILLA